MMTDRSAAPPLDNGTRRKWSPPVLHTETLAPSTMFNIKESASEEQTINNVTSGPTISS
jgi:hypothetical protein